MSRREKRKPSKPAREARRAEREASELAAAVRNTTATYRSSFETGRDAESECNNRRDDLLLDLSFRRLAHEIWRGRPGAEPLVAAMADLIAETERHLAAIEQLARRFDDLANNETWYETLGPDLVPEELIRRRLFSDPEK
jgi:hypothetical protein